MDVYRAIKKRRSIRQFKDVPLSYAILEKCVDAARLAPTAMNCQLYEYVVVDDEGLMRKVLNAVNVWSGVPKPEEGWSPEQRPKAYIITLINCTLETELSGTRRVTTYDVGMAMENMMLVALEQGIGSCPILSFKESGLRQILNISDNYDIALVLVLGYPDESSVLEIFAGSHQHWTDEQGTRHLPKRKLEDIMHRNKFP